MLMQSIALSLIASVPFAQMPAVPVIPQPAPASITVPPGTLVALKLVSTIKSKSSKSGDPVRAVVAFPLAIGNQIAIPATTYVEGTILKVSAHLKGADSPTVQIRFN